MEVNEFATTYVPRPRKRDERSNHDGNYPFDVRRTRSIKAVYDDIQERARLSPMEDFDRDTEKESIVDITKLREERRPMWMSSFGLDHPADMVGGGGDIYTDRLVPEWPRNYGQELAGDGSEISSNPGEQEFSTEEFPPKSDLAKLAEEAFRYVHSD